MFGSSLGRRVARALPVVLLSIVVGCSLYRAAKPPLPFTPEQRAFMRKAAALPPKSEARKAFFEKARAGVVGPRPRQLREAAVAEIVPLSEGLLFGCDKVVVDVRVTPELRHAVAETGSKARVMRVMTSDLDKWADDPKAARIHVESVDYYVGGTCALVRVSIRQGKAYGFSPAMFFVCDDGEWRLPTPNELRTITGNRGAGRPSGAQPTTVPPAS